LIKKIVQSASIIAVSPLIILHLVTSLWTQNGIFIFSVQLLSLIPGKIGSYCRVAFNRFAMSHCHRDCVIGFCSVFSQPDTEINQGVYIGPQCNIGQCRIGQDTLIASGVHIMSGNNQHGTDLLDVPIQQQQGKYRKVIIGEDCWVGNGSLIMADVGKKCIIGAGSVVTKPIPDFSIAVGNPAKVIKNRLDDNKKTDVGV